MNLSSRIAWVSAFFFAVASFYAPLAYGCTRPEMLPTLYVLLGAGIVTGLLSFMGAGARPAIPGLVLLCAVATLAQGWYVTWDPIFPDLTATTGGASDSDLQYIRQLSFDSMVMTSILLISFVVLCGLMANLTQRRFILLAAAVSGALICIIGVVLKVAGEPLMRYVWKPEDLYWNDFALFHYHGNAGAFLNLVWPLLLVFTRRAYAVPGGLLKKLGWTLFSLLCGASLFLNASKSALVIGLLVLPWPFMTWLMRLKRSTLLILVVCAVVVIAGALAASTQFGTEDAFQRMTNSFEVTGSVEGRMADYRADLTDVPEAGAFGLGPGLYKVAFPYQTSEMRNVGAAVRDYAHEDYLQTLLEWGWFGTFWWTLLVVGGLYRAFRTYGQRVYFTSRTERHLLLAAILGVIATLAQAFIDFPLQIASLRLFFFILLALCWASPQLLTLPRRESRTRYRLVIPAEVGAESGRGEE